jgi:hypothetical protein
MLQDSQIMAVEQSKTHAYTIKHGRRVQTLDNDFHEWQRTTFEPSEQNVSNDLGE